MNIVIDLDDTLFYFSKDKTWDIDYGKYSSCMPNKDEIRLLNILHKKGHRVIIHTGRNWDKYELTKKQLKQFKVRYDELVMGKPQGIYIDNDSRRTLKDL